MTPVSLTGRLVCATRADADLVEQLLPDHIALTRAERGCLSFAVTRRIDEPLVWDVDELFDGEGSFRAHQARVAASEWGRRTAAIPRDYVVVGLG